MDIKIVEEKKNKLVFDILGDEHTISNMLRSELWTDEHVKASAYAIEHPLIGNPRFILETDGAEPRKTVQSAVKRLQKQLEKVKSEAKNLK
ncbi:DNA-directed RNA polymerase subunit L [Candidatus Woesearchaeota archaeon CG10_big_fil_rev_8_21_14_0_10_37_12]|nr:MAG: DNA-directed RNA polymerase subunit L [Candidatus Woesearchaeota archaeon CG10_big_fil_rev_8_21_14_0_10_37_12]